MKLKGILVGLISLVYLTLNNALMACSSCNAVFSYSKEKINAYFDTTIFMGILPVSFISLIIFLAYKQSKSTNN